MSIAAPPEPALGDAAAGLTAGIVSAVDRTVETCPTGSGDNAGIGFAIPIQTARQIADQLVGGAD